MEGQELSALSGALPHTKAVPPDLPGKGILIPKIFSPEGHRFNVEIDSPPRPPDLFRFLSEIVAQPGAYEADVYVAVASVVAPGSRAENVRSLYGDAAGFQSIEVTPYRFQDCLWQLNHLRNLLAAAISCAHSFFVSLERLLSRISG